MYFVGDGRLPSPYRFISLGGFGFGAVPVDFSLLRLAVQDAFRSGKPLRFWSCVSVDEVSVKGASFHIQFVPLLWRNLNQNKQL